MFRESIEAGVRVPWLRSKDDAGVMVRLTDAKLGSRCMAPLWNSGVWFANSEAVRC